MYFLEKKKDSDRRSNQQCTHIKRRKGIRFFSVRLVTKNETKKKEKKKEGKL